MLLLSVVSLLIAGVVSGDEKLPPPCFSEIYCYGRVIDTVMKAHIFNDSKTYVDLKLKQPTAETLLSFDVFMTQVNSTPTKEQLQHWVDLSFDDKGSELEEWTPVDHKTDIAVIKRIRDPVFKQFAQSLNDIWLELSRKMKDEVKDEVSCSGLVFRRI